MNVPATLHAARTRALLTQAELAGRTGTSQATVSAYEAGAKAPSVATLERLLAATGTRLLAEGGHEPLSLPSAPEQERIARQLTDVLALAAALPTRHRRTLAYPRLTARSK